MKRYKIVLLSILAVMISLSSCKKAKKEGGTSIIPTPTFEQLHNGVFNLTVDTKIVCGDREDILPVAKYLAESLGRHLSFQPAVEVGSVDDRDHHAIALFIDNTCADLNDEGYCLQVRRKGIELHANTPKGLFYGVQSLFQMFPPAYYRGEITDHMDIQGVQVKDEPRFAYRGMHLDVCRHMFPVEFIKEYIDLLAMYKFNTFHWHLTEDQGWRIEIKQYPKLTEIGAYRDSTAVGHGGVRPLKYDGQPYGGYYTQDEVREIVAYAQQRMITIIPEIEMPGHSLAALAAYPELACTDGPFKVGTAWGVFEDIYCPKEETFTFLENVLTEVMDLFPGTYIHIGGDEAPKERWKESAFCQQLMKDQGLKDEHELQSYFIHRIEKFVNSKGRKIIGWDEILEGGLSPNATVMSWRGTEGGMAAARQGHDAIMTPGSHCYFDHYQADPDFQPLAIGGFTTLKKVFDYEPVPSELTPEEAQHILGAQANVWTEYIATPEHVEYMILPRMAALSEVVWAGPSQKDWSDFQRRIADHQLLYQAMELNYCEGSFAVNIETKPQKTEGQVLVSLTSEIYQAEIRYTTDGSVPTGQSVLYTEPFSAKVGTTITAAVFREDQLMEKPTTKTID